MRVRAALPGVVLVSVLCSVLATAATAVAADRVGRQAASSIADVRVAGTVAAPRTYTGADLAALPQTTLPDRRGPARGTVTGVELEDLVTAAEPQLPAGAKNGQLRVVVTVTGTSGSRAIALGEVDPGFGDHPALLALEQEGRPVSDGSWLAVPGDHGYARTVSQVTRVQIDIVTPAVPAPASGSVVVSGPDGPTILTAARVAELPTTTKIVTFLAGTAPQTHIETGPSLISVLRAAHVRRTATTAIAAVGADGYVASVTASEATVGRRALLLSLTEDGVPLSQPRLVTAGDLKGGRYVSDVVGLSVTETATDAAPAGD